MSPIKLANPSPGGVSMKRFLGWVLAGVGLSGIGWGGFHVLSGNSDMTLRPLPLNALTATLAGVALLTLGLVWVRD